MLQPVYWPNAEAQTSEGKVENVVVVLWDWDAKQGKAMLNGCRVDVYMTDYSEADLRIGAKNACDPAHYRDALIS